MSEPDGPSDEVDAERLNRRERRSRLRQVFGRRLLTTFAVLLTLVTFVVFGLAGWAINSVTYDALEQQHSKRLQSVAAMATVELNQPLVLFYARNPSEEYHDQALKKLQEQCLRIKHESRVSEVVLFMRKQGADPKLPDYRVLASSAGGPETHQAALTRLYADNLVIEQARIAREPASSKLYPFQQPDGEWRNFKSGYAPLVDAETEEVIALVSVEIPVEFTRDVDTVNTYFIVLGAIAGLLVLAAAVLLVRQRVHLPVYRLVKAMQAGDGGRPKPTRVRYHDEIGVLTERYNEMVDRMDDQDARLRDLYAQAQETASYLKGYSEHLVAGVPTGTVAVDPAGALTVCNPSARRILGVGGQRGEPADAVFGEDHPVARALRRALRRSVTDQALIILDEAGARDSGSGDVDDPEIQRLVELTCAPFFGEGGELLGAVALVNDRTELERFRRAASRNERLAAIGNLGAGLAHEIKNPLSAISGFAELIERKEGADAARLAKRLRGEVEELNTFLNEFLSFTREDKIRREPTDLNQLVVRSVELALSGQELDPTEILKALEGSGGHLTLPTGTSLQLRFELDEALPPLALDAALLRSACRCLAENAIQVMAPKGGELTLRTHRVGEMVFIRFRDQGPGVPIGDREKIFNPLFTTRAEGTGLGLAIANKTVNAHGGKLSLRDAPGGGAEFVIRLPVVEARATPTQPLPAVRS